MSKPSDRLQHPIFQNYKATGSMTAWYGAVSTPYRVYDGFGMLIGGTCDPTAARKLVRHEEMVPALTQDRRGLVALWISNYTDSSAGPHTEFQFSLFMAPKPISDIPAHPFALMEAMLNRDQFYMMPHGVWNNTDKAMSYKAEILALPTQMADSVITRLPKRFDFSFSAPNPAGESALICNGSLKDNGRASVSDQLEFMRFMSFARVRELQQLPFRDLFTVNPVGGVIARNEPTKLIFGNDREWLRFWDPKADHVSLEHPAYAELDLQFDFVQRFEGMRVVHATPRSIKLDHLLITDTDATVGQHAMTPL